MADLDAIIGKSAVRISKWKERLLYIETIGPTVPFSFKRLSLTVMSVEQPCFQPSTFL